MIATAAPVQTRVSASPAARTPWAAPYGLEEVLLGSSSALKALIVCVEDVIGVRPSLRITALSQEQWLAALAAALPSELALAAARHRHLLPDPADPHHLLVAPTALSGINGGDRVVYAEVVYTVLRANPAPLNRLLRLGLDDWFADRVSERLGVRFYTRNELDGKALMSALVTCLAAESGHAELSWARLFRRSHEQSRQALARSGFGRTLAACVRRQPELSERFCGLTAAALREALAVALLDEDIAASAPLYGAALRAAREAHS